MESTTPLSPTQNSTTIVTRKVSFFENPKFKVFLPLILIIIGIGIYYAYRTFNNPENKIIATIGAEKIYQKDYDLETKYITSTTKDASQLIKDRLTEDSVALQAAQAAQLITLDPSIYDSSSKDYVKRRQVVENVKNLIDQKVDTLEGTMLGVWFLNNRVGPLGYLESKKIANAKITKLYTQVKSGQMTIQQAGQAIKDDSTLIQIDPAYKVNAIVNFKVRKEEKLTTDDKFNELLWTLPVGGLTQITTLKSQDFGNGGTMVEAYYVFAQITAKQSNGVTAGYDTWIQDQKTKYEVKYL
jgi:hypothetical protein